MLYWLLGLLAALVALFYLTSGEGGALAGLEGGEIAMLVMGLSLAGLYLASLAGDYRGRILEAARHAGIWIALALMLVAGYAFRDEIGSVADRVGGELLPPGTALTIGTADTERAVRLRKHPDGHFVAKGTVNGANIELLVDTGASTVVLKPTDAVKAGIDTTTLEYTVRVSTANGATFAAPIRIERLSIGAIEVENIEALVAKPGNLNESLLGMSFLRRLKSYEFSGDFLTLRG